MNVEFGQAAVGDLARAVAFYDTQNEGLGRLFAREVRATMELIVGYPRAGVRLSPRVRRLKIQRFPYGVFYRHEGDTITVARILDLRSDPASWRGMLEEFPL